MAVEILHGDRRALKTFPHKELQDYWSSRPHYGGGTNGGYEPVDGKPGVSWLGLAHTLASEENPDEPSPPPYTLEAKNGPDDRLLTAPSSPSPDNHQDYNILTLTNNLGRHTLGNPSTQSSSRSHIPGGFGPEPSLPSSPNLSPTGPGRPSTGQSSPASADKPTPPPKSSTPLIIPPPVSSCFSPPVGASQDVGISSMPVPQVVHGSNPHRLSVNPDAPFPWNDYPGGLDPNVPSNPWDPPASTKQETPYPLGYQPNHSPPPPIPYHTRPPIPSATKPTSPPKSPHEGVDTLNPSPSFNTQGNSPSGGYNPPYPRSQSTYPGQVGPGSYYGYDQKTDGKGDDGWGKPSPSNTSYPGQTYGGLPPPSNFPPPSQGHGQYQSSYYGSMTSSPAPGPADRPTRPPTRPPTSNSPPLHRGRRRPRSFHPGMGNSPTPVPDRPSTSHSYPTRPNHKSNLPPQPQPPLPGGYDHFPSPTQEIHPSGSSPPPLPYQPTGHSSYGYQLPHQRHQSTYPGDNPPPPSASPYLGYPGSRPPLSLPSRECHYTRLPFTLCEAKKVLTLLWNLMMMPGARDDGDM